jgi:hypothetical protein
VLPMTNLGHSHGLVQHYREEARGTPHARRTISTFVQWLRKLLRFYQMRHPRGMGGAEFNAFLSHLATQEQVSASTQNQAVSALLFFYRSVIGGDVGKLEGKIRARRRAALLCRTAVWGHRWRLGPGRSRRVHRGLRGLHCALWPRVISTYQGTACASRLVNRGGLVPPILKTCQRNGVLLTGATRFVNREGACATYRQNVSTKLRFLN